MLTNLQLKDVVIVDHAELEFGAGLTALTGETGAGKSIVVDALLLIAGGRGGSDMVRMGSERAEVTASFAALPPAAIAWLEAQLIAYEDEVVIRRVIGADGRSRAYVNGQLVPLQQLREFADLLLEIHGQQEFQHLVKRGAQRDLLDEQIAPALRARVAESYRLYRDCRQDCDALDAASTQRDARLEILRYQTAELKGEVTSVAAIEQLLLEQKRMSSSGRLGAAASAALTAVYDADSNSAHDTLAKAAAAVRSVADTDPAAAAPAQMLGEACILVHEAAEMLRRYLDKLDVDPGRQEVVERQTAALESLARKHRHSVLDLPAHLINMEAELGNLERADVNLAELQHKLAGLKSDYDKISRTLTEARQLAAVGLGEQITRLMQTLGMAGGRFAADVVPDPDAAGPTGVDGIEFLVSANPGQPLRGLAKVASGGELSRISLAVQVAAAAKSTPLCMVFDEVDTGIGGGTAEIVGRRLRELGSRSQVLCVTHLAQVAAQAHHQIQVSKHTDGTKTRTVLTTLGSADRVEEIARMIGGVDVSEQARAHAAAMLHGVDTAESAPDSPPRTQVQRAAAGRHQAKGR